MRIKKFRDIFKKSDKSESNGFRDFKDFVDSVKPLMLE